MGKEKDLVLWIKYFLNGVKANNHSTKEYLTVPSPIPWKNVLLRWCLQHVTNLVVLFQGISFVSRPNK